MVYIKKWTDFESAATDLYAKAPTKVRYCVKFKPQTGQLVLKLTDDTTCLKYKTFSSIILNRFESLNLRLLSQIANAKPRARIPLTSASLSGRAGTPMDDEELGGTGVGDNKERSGTPALDPGGAGKGAGTLTTGGGGKKKKKGKR